MYQVHDSVEAACLVAQSNPHTRVLNAEPGVVESRGMGFLVDPPDPPEDASPKRPEHPDQRLLSEFRDGIVVDSSTLMTGGDDGQTELVELIEQ